MVFKDQLNRTLNLTKEPVRIVSLVPSLTELLAHLGLENKIVGVTKFCVHPEHIREVSSVVGGTKSVHLDKIKELHPDIIICNKEENTKEMVEELEKIAPVHVSNIVEIKDVFEIIEMYGQIFSSISKKATALIEQITHQKSHFQTDFKDRKLNVAYMIWRQPWMAAGGDTFINTLLKLNGLTNVFENRSSRYPEIDLNELKDKKPDIILLSSEPYPFKDHHIREIQQTYKVPVILIDGEFFSWYGSRLIPAFDYFAKFQRQLSTFL